MRVVATAGHVDHGKSSLVLALTGTDPDRWPEEKTRGLTIDLGFAFTTLPSGQELGFVDVPGHVRFLKNMLAGVGAVEAAILVVAATEGWMPQSEEHLRILDLLGISHGLAVITKADLVDDDLLELARLEVEERLAAGRLVHARPTCWPSTPAPAGGSSELRVALDDMLASAPLAADRGRPRLWVDRVFAAKGAGTVVTGTMAGGTLPLDAEVLILPGRKRARVRHIESHHEELAEAGPGRRVALNLAGIDHTELTRGSALVLPDQWAVTVVVDAALTALPEVELRQGTYKAYIGSGEHDVRLRLIRPRHPRAPTTALFGRLRLDVPLPLQPGDRIVLRDSGSQATVGGAEVLDVSPVGRARLAAGRLPLPAGPRILAGRPWLRPGGDRAAGRRRPGRGQAPRRGARPFRGRPSGRGAPGGGRDPGRAAAPGARTRGRLPPAPAARTRLRPPGAGRRPRARRRPQPGRPWRAPSGLVRGAGAGAAGFPPGPGGRTSRRRSACSPPSTPSPSRPRRRPRSADHRRSCGACSARGSSSTSTARSSRPPPWRRRARSSGRASSVTTVR